MTDQNTVASERVDDPEVGSRTAGGDQVLAAGSTRRLVACWLAMAAGAVICLLQLAGPWDSPCVPNPNVQIAGSAADAWTAVTLTDPPCWRSSDEPSRPVAGAHLERYWAGLITDEKAPIVVSWWFTIGSTMFLVGVFGWGWMRLYSTKKRVQCAWAIVAACILFVLDSVENIATVAGLNSLDIRYRGNPLGQVAGNDDLFAVGAASSVIKYALTVPVLGLAGFVFCILLLRSFGKLHSEIGTQPGANVDGIIAPGRWTETRWKPDGVKVKSARTLDETEPRDPDTQRWLDGAPLLPGRYRAGLTISASGGGIRSAVINLGALQQLRKERAGDDQETILGQADYLVSVSGGGFMAGAFRLALQKDENGNPGAGPTSVFARGSVEEDHVRRHANYLADGAREWVVALGVLFRGVLASLGVIALVVVLAGLLVSLFYEFVPVTCVEALRPEFAPAEALPRTPACAQLVDQFQHRAEGGWPPFPRPIHAGLQAMAFLLVVGGLAWFVYVSITGLGVGSWGDRAEAFGAAITVVFGITAIYVVVLPSSLWLTAWLSYRLPGSPGPGDAGAVAAAVAFLTWMGALTTALWRTVRRFAPSGEAAPRFRKGVKSLESAVGTSLLSRVIVAAVLAVVVLFFLQVFAVTATTAADLGELRLPTTIAVAAAVILLWLCLDQTRVSLHPFYRKRLSTAFAVRRVPDRVSGSAARAYDWSERTSLTTHAQPVPGFPTVLFAASAAVTGAEQAPPGRRVVSLTFAHDYVGGPDIGWVKTSLLEKHSPAAIQGDLTVQSAVAVSGAAIASSMGRLANPAQRLLALSNVRLGTWLPNPSYLARLALAHDKDLRWMPRVPHVRRLKYHLREVAGAFGGDDRMMLCTDGGHYENLGLVEALRLGCKVLIVIDGTGDAPPFADTLGQAIALAREELGVEITFPRQALLDLVPGSIGDQVPVGLESLGPRLSRSCVAVGRIRYPAPLQPEQGRGVPFSSGTIVFAKACLTVDMPYDLLTYALHETTFPRQHTADQWFNHRQFDAYQTLGTFLGAAAADALRTEAP